MVEGISRAKVKERNMELFKLFTLKSETAPYITDPDITAVICSEYVTTRATKRIVK